MLDRMFHEWVNLLYEALKSEKNKYKSLNDLLIGIGVPEERINEKFKEDILLAVHNAYGL